MSPLLPPRPSLSAASQTYRFFRDPFRLLSECRRELGDLFTLRILGMGTCVFVSTPEHARAVFKAAPDHLASGEINAASLGFMLGHDATFCLDGEEHLARRRLIHPFFNGPGVLEKFEDICAVIQRAADQIPEEETFSFHAMSLRLSLDVIMRLLFGSSPRDEVLRLTDAFDRFAHEGLRSPLLLMPALQLNLGPWSPWGRIMRLRREVLALIEDAIRLREQHLDYFNDTAAALVRWMDESGKRLPSSAIRDELVNDIFAGHETTGNSLAWCLACALGYPTVIESVRAELVDVLGGKSLAVEHLHQLKFTRAFIDECFRLRPLGPMEGLRVAKRAFSLGEFVLPTGTIVVHSTPLFAERPELFERPEAFAPERFLQKKHAPFSWNPFGGGRRICLGKGLAEVELAAALAILLTQFDFELAQDTVVPQRAGFFFAPSGGLQVRARRRRAFA